MRPLFSIIIPALNEEKFIPRLLLDLSEQKEKNFEVIVVDSFSTDNTQGKVRQYKRALPLRFFRLKTNNVSKVRNYGSSKAKGGYLIFLDADSQINPNFTRVLRRTIEKNSGLVYIPAIVPDKKTLDMEVTFGLINYLVEFSQNLTRPFSTGGSMIVEKNFFVLLGGFDERLFLAEDHNLIQKAQRWGVKARFITNLKLRFSLRRMKKEGRLTLLYKYLLVAAHMLFKGDVEKKIVNYPMGGSPYNSKKIPQKDPDKAIKMIRDFFQSLK